MDIIQKFGNAVSSMSLEDPEKARRLLLTGYRLQEKRLLFFPDKKLPQSGQYVAEIVMKNIIQALSKPENSAMVSIFVPGELLTAAGLTPYSVEAMSCFIAGTRCEQTFLRKTEEEGFPETMCSYHRVFLGAALSGLVPKPKCMIYTNLACDSNMMTFPYLKQKNMLSGLFIDVPYDKNEDSVKYVADIIYGLNVSVASKVGALAARLGKKNPGEYMMTGGVAKNPGIIKALEEKLDAKLYICDEAQLCGVLGAALFAYEKCSV